MRVWTTLRRPPAIPTGRISTDMITPRTPDRVITAGATHLTLTESVEATQATETTSHDSGACSGPPWP